MRSFDAMQSGQLTRETAGDLIRGGHANVMIGQPGGALARCQA
jgi:hypothetical protein